MKINIILLSQCAVGLQRAKSQNPLNDLISGWSGQAFRNTYKVSMLHFK